MSAIWRTCVRPRRWAGRGSGRGGCILGWQGVGAGGGGVGGPPADVCNLEDMRAATAMGVARFGTVRAVIHAAGVVDDGPLMLKTPAEVEEVFAPKLHGTLVLDRLFPDGALDWMVLFSNPRL